MDYSLPGSSFHRILQARILEWVSIPLYRGTSWPRDQTQYLWLHLKYTLKNLKSEIKQNIKFLHWVKVSLRGLSTRCEQQEGARKVLQLKTRSCIIVRASCWCSAYASQNHWTLTASTEGPPAPYPLGMTSNCFLLFLPLPGWGIQLSCLHHIPEL